MEYFEKPVTYLKPDFPAYCVYVPSGMAEAFTQELVRSIRVWGRNMGKNLLVCYWDIGTPEFIDLMKKIGWRKRPFLFLTNKHEITDNSYILSIDDQELIRNIEELQKLLPQLLDLILFKDYVQAAEKALKGKREEDLRNLLSKNFDQKYKFTVSGFGFSVSTYTQSFENETKGLIKVWKSLVSADCTVDERGFWSKILEIYYAHPSDLNDVSIHIIENMILTVPILLTTIKDALMAGQQEKADGAKQTLMLNYQSLIKALQ